MKTKLAIIGASELGKQILFQAENNCNYVVVGFFDDFYTSNNYLGKPIIGKIDLIQSSYDNNVFDELIIAIGYTRFDYKAKIFEQFKHLPFATLIHPEAIIENSSKIGKGVIIYPKAYIGPNVNIEDNVLVNISTTLSHDITIKSHSYISPSVCIGGYSEIGSKVFIGIGSSIIDHINICTNAFIGAGSVVIKNISEYGTYVGSPTKKIK